MKVATQMVGHMLQYRFTVQFKNVTIESDWHQTLIAAFHDLQEALSSYMRNMRKDNTDDLILLEEEI